MILHAVVVNYRTPKDLDRFLRTWTENAPACTWRLVICNVDPLPDDIAIGESWENRATVHFPFNHNVGYARACNSGAFADDADVYAFFNADVWFRDDAIDRVLGAMAANPDWGVVGPRQVDSRGRVTHAGIFGTPEAPKHRGWHMADSPAYGDVCPAVTVSGAAYFVQGDAWRSLTNCEIYQKSVDDLGVGPALGAFLPTPHYYEETWCSYHAAAHGWSVMYFGEATVVHEWHQASPVGGHADQLMGASRLLFRAACDDHGIARD